jgi:hypothetical protein
MRYLDPLKQILEQGRAHWDNDEFPMDARVAFRKACQCGTPALGAEVYASEDHELIVNHKCKSRACTTCGHWATMQWQRTRRAALPDVDYKAIILTMPDLLWRFFRDNPRLTGALPALAASVIQAYMTAKHGLQVGVIAILHTFNGRLEFNSHVHTMVSAGGLQESSGQWVPSVYYNDNQIMRMWREAVIKLLLSAHRRGLLRTEMPLDQVEPTLLQQAARWWSIKIQSLKSKAHFLGYAGRYVRRPPIAQRRIVHIGEGDVTFWTKDKKSRRIIEVHCSLQEFIERWAQHIPARYKHAIRYFGLLAPRSVSRVAAAIFAILGQEQRSRPKPLRWADSIERTFGYDPLVDKIGQRMYWVHRVAPSAASQS